MFAEKNKVFIVDDDESVCRALKCLMQTYGYAVETFLSGAAFLGSVAEVDPGCLVLDINMPGFNGWEVQRKLSLAGSRRKFIVMTADKDDGFRQRALAVGAVGFLQKPFNDQQIVNLINQAF